MKYERGYRSKNTIDRRASSGGRAGGGVALAGGGGLLGVLALLLVNVLGGQGFDLGSVLSGIEGGPVVTEPRDPNLPDPDGELDNFVQFAFDDAQTLWQEIFADAGLDWRDATLVLYTDVTQSGCGRATSAVGPFYCPADETVHIDLDFFRDLASPRFGAPGDFAQAYVVAHEVGHHVQNVLGISGEVRQLQQQRPSDRNELSVRLELQADCFSGVWARGVEEAGLLERGDIPEALAAAAAVGDDRIQSQAGIDISPETWTHGSSQQRQAWFDRGFASGDPNDCNSFSG